MHACTHAHTHSSSHITVFFLGTPPRTQSVGHLRSRRNGGSLPTFCLGSVRRPCFRNATVWTAWSSTTTGSRCHPSDSWPAPHWTAGARCSPCAGRPTTSWRSLACSAGQPTPTTTAGCLGWARTCHPCSARTGSVGHSTGRTRLENPRSQGQCVFSKNHTCKEGRKYFI